MVLNFIWIGFFLVAFIVAVLSFALNGDTNTFKAIIDATFSASRMAVIDIALPLTGIMTLWLGLMNIGERAGAIRVLSRIVGPFFSRLFPEIPKNHPASGQLLMNFSANMLGLDNAATPVVVIIVGASFKLAPTTIHLNCILILFEIFYKDRAVCFVKTITIVKKKRLLHFRHPNQSPKNETSHHPPA